MRTNLSISPSPFPFILFFLFLFYLSVRISSSKPGFQAIRKICLAMLGFEWRILKPGTWSVASPAHLGSWMTLSMKNQAGFGHCKETEPKFWAHSSGARGNHRDWPPDRQTYCLPPETHLSTRCHDPSARVDNNLGKGWRCSDRESWLNPE